MVGNTVKKTVLPWTGTGLGFSKEKGTAFFDFGTTRCLATSKGSWTSFALPIAAHAPTPNPSPQRERALGEWNGESVILRTDHIAGGAFVAFGLVVLASSGDLPVGTLSFPGAGMMPKLVAGLLVAFGLLIVLRAGESAPLATVRWEDLPHAARVVAVTAAAVALYQTLGFLLTMALLLFALTFGAERRHPLAAAAFSIGVVALTYLLFVAALKTSLEPGILGF